MTEDKFMRFVYRTFYAAMALIVCGLAGLLLAGCVAVWREVLR